MPTSTPWGISDASEKVAFGIMYYVTPGHGGYHLSQGRLKQMPRELLVSDNPYFQRLIENGWFEEDCEWARVALAFPQFFSADVVEHAHELGRLYFPSAYSVWLQVVVGSADPKMSQISLTP